MIDRSPSLADQVKANLKERIGFDQANRPVVQALSFFRDDLLRFRLIRRKSGA